MTELSSLRMAKLDALNIPIIEARVERVRQSDGEAHALELNGGMVLDCDQIFFSIGQEPSDDLGAHWAARVMKSGELSSIFIFTYPSGTSTQPAPSFTTRRSRLTSRLSASAIFRDA